MCDLVQSLPCIFISTAECQSAQRRPVQRTVRVEDLASKMRHEFLQRAGWVFGLHHLPGQYIQIDEGYLVLVDEQ